MQRQHILAAALVMTLMSMSTHAEIQQWQLIAKVRSTTEGFEPPSFLKVGSKVKVIYHVDLDAPLSGGLYYALPYIKFNKDGSGTDGGYVIAWEGFTAFNTSIEKPREDGVNFVSYNCPGEHAPASISDALAICVSMMRQFEKSNVRFDIGTDSVWAEPLSFQLMTKP